jgi:hypothetical protein
MNLPVTLSSQGMDIEAGIGSIFIFVIELTIRALLLVDDVLVTPS